MVVPITGIQTGRGPNGELPIRREIDEWWFSKDINDLNQRSLFIYAINAIQQRGLAPEKSDDRSYLSIAGIHGYPLRPWPANPEDTKTSWYCAHGVVTFATWHTPYMLLFEQRLHEEMIALIPKTFAEDDQKDMMRAAQTWRLPFWDWAMKKPNWNPDNEDDPVNRIPGSGPNMPFLTTQRQVTVRTKTGSAPVKNPWFHFELPRPHNFGSYGVTDDDAPWYGACRVTSRRPKLSLDMDKTKWHALSAEEKESYTEGKYQRWEDVQKQLQGSVQNSKYFANTLPEAVYRLFRSVDKNENPVMSYDTFSTGSFHFGQQVKDYPSLEAIHNNIHNFVGGSGFMGDPATAAFDPIFWLHHCNVDRLLAIWQDLYETQTKTWLDAKSEQDGSLTKLAPFVDKDKKTFTSLKCCYKHQELGYTYPELKKWLFTKDGVLDRGAYTKSIREEIERYYSTTPKAALLLESNAKVAAKQMAAMTPENLQVEHFPEPLLDLVPKAVADDAQLPLGEIPRDGFGNPTALSWESNDYVVNVVYERFALGGLAYSVTFFLGDVPNHTSYDFADDPSAISRVYNFSSPVEGRGIDETGCSNCKKQRDEHALFSGQVILTDYLIELITLAQPQRGLTLMSLDNDEVVAYLKKNLHWRITDIYNNPVLKENMPSLKVSVATARGTHYSEASKSSHYTPYTILWDATQGRLGGAAPGQI